MFFFGFGLCANDILQVSGNLRMSTIFPGLSVDNYTVRLKVSKLWLIVVVDRFYNVIVKERHGVTRIFTESYFETHLALTNQSQLRDFNYCITGLEEFGL